MRSLKTFRLVCVMGWFAAIVVLSLLPPSTAQLQFFHLSALDKLLHAVAYGGGAALLYWAVGVPGFWRRLGVMVVVPLILGGVLELVQPLVGRLCSAGDMLANGAGVATVAGAICFSRLLSMRRVDAQRV